MVLVDEQFTTEQLWTRYQNAFHEFAGKAAHVQFLSAHRPRDYSAIDAALLELETARRRYNDCRDAWASRLLPGAEVILTPDYTDRVRQLAALRWEVTGRPEGTADYDWLRAEEILRLADAA